MSADRNIEDALDAITEGTAVDWDLAVESAEDASTRGTLEALSVLARIQDLSPGDPSELPFRWGALEVVEPLGSGTFGTVFRARDTALDLDVALKVLHSDIPEATARILEEGRWLARLRHPNIVRVFGIDERDGRIGLRMELVEGRSLDEIVRTRGPFGPHEALRIGIDVCRALAAVHSAGLVHRDVKAQNVLQEETGRLVLMDFGAGSETRERGEEKLTGTPLYLAPELLDGRGASPASDLYALGVLLYFLASGSFPVHASDLEGVKRAHRTGGVRPLALECPELPDALLRAVDRALSPAPSDRYVSAEEMARALASALVSDSDQTRARPTDARRNLPVQLTRFIGRRRALEAISELLRSHRLVTLTGAGGSGKTRLAIELANDLGDAFDDGLWFVPLTRVRSEKDVAAAFARALGMRFEGRESLSEAIAHALEDQHALLVVDNCEHVVASVARLIMAVLAEARAVKVIATSRQPLGIAGEMTFDVPPLELPASMVAGRGDTNALSDGIEESEAVQLFVERARAARSDFVLEGDGVRHVVEICRRLDGLPLALELAAARVRVLPLAAIVRRLDDRFTLLRSGELAEPAHHGTLSASIAWSYDLLEKDERLALGRLSLFTGGWTLAGAETVVSANSGIARERVVDILSQLVSKSLVRLDGAVASDARYHMLETVREFAVNRLSGDEKPAAHTAFLDWCVAIAADAHLQIIGSGVKPAMDVFEAEHDNLVSGCRLSLAAGRGNDGLRVASHMGRYWQTSTRWSEGRRVLEELIEHPNGAERTVDRAAALSWVGVFALSQAQPDIARPCFEECMSIHEECGDEHGVAMDLNHFGVLAYDVADFEAARKAFTESLSRRRKLDETRGIAQSLTNLALCEVRQENFDGARALFEEALATHRELGNEWGIAKILGDLGYLRGRVGDYDGAKEVLGQAIELYTKLGPATEQHCYLGHVHRRHGALDEARKSYETSISGHTDSGRGGRPSEALRGLALIEMEEGEGVTAARLLGAADATRRVALNARDERETSEGEARLRASLGDQVFEREYRSGFDAERKRRARVRQPGGR